MIFLFTGKIISAQTPKQVPPPPPPPLSQRIVTTQTDSSGKIQKDTNEVFTFAEVMPVFPGGQPAFQKYLQDNITYPSAEKKAGKQGTVYVQFVIEPDGSIANVKVVKGIPDAPGLSQEAIRVISEMPKWTPGEMNGKKVPVVMTQPIRFILQDNTPKGKRK